MALVPQPNTGSPQTLSAARSARTRLLRNKSALFSISLLILMLAVIVAPGLFARQSPDQLNLSTSLEAPSLMHFFGTDDLGRDVFSRTMYGIQLSVLAAAGVVAIAATLGTAVGLVAGYVSGVIGEILMRIADIFIAFPTLIIAMAIVAVLGPSLLHAMISIGILWWPQYARLVRSLVLQEASKDYPRAAFALGASQVRIMVRHILPNCINPILVRASLDVGTALLLTASLGFLGLGAQPPSPELGSAITQGRSFLFGAWWYPTFPGLALFSCILTTVLIGDVLHDWLDPKGA